MGESQTPLTAEDRLNHSSALYFEFMRSVGLPDDAEARDTARRVSRMFLEDFTKPRAFAPVVALFPANGYDEYVAVTNVEYASMCSHHHLPFEGVAHFVYHPNEHLAGLSKIPRVIRHFASRPTLQEHLTQDIAEYLFEQLQPHALMLVLEGTHACMRCRGVRDPRSRTRTSKILKQKMARVDKDEMLRLMGL